MRVDAAIKFVLIVAGDKRERTPKDSAGRIDLIDGKVGS